MSNVELIRKQITDPVEGITSEDLLRTVHIVVSRALQEEREA